MLIVNARALEVPPPGVGLNTVNCAEPDCGDIACRDGGRQLGATHEGRGPVGAIPPYDRSRNEVIAADRQGEGRAAGHGAAGESAVIEGTGFVLVTVTVTVGLVAARVLLLLR